MLRHKRLYIDNADTASCQRRIWIEFSDLNLRIRLNNRPVFSAAVSNWLPDLKWGLHNARNLGDEGGDLADRWSVRRHGATCQTRCDFADHTAG